MKLWGTHLSTFLLRVLFCARIKGHDLPCEAPDDTSSAAFHALNPLGKVPVLQDGDFVLPESMAIIDYLEEVLPGPSVWPDEVKERARARMLCEIVDLYLHPAMFDRFLPDLAQGPGKGAGERLTNALDAVEHYLRDGDTWLCGDRPTVPDGHITTCFFYFEAIGVHYGAPGLIVARPKLAAWWARAKANPLVAQLLAEQDAAFWPAWKDMLPLDYARCAER